MTHTELCVSPRPSKVACKFDLYRYAKGGAILPARPAWGGGGIPTTLRSHGEAPPPPLPNTSVPPPVGLLHKSNPVEPQLETARFQPVSLPLYPS
jgi:hypothetical protein